VSQLLKRELELDEIDWIRSEIEKRRMVRKMDQETCSHAESTSRTEYENAFKVDKHSLLS
jgi:hypothetical protein